MNQITLEFLGCFPKVFIIFVRIVFFRGQGRLDSDEKVLIFLLENLNLIDQTSRFSRTFTGSNSIFKLDIILHAWFRIIFQSLHKSSGK